MISLGHKPITTVGPGDSTTPVTPRSPRASRSWSALAKGAVRRVSRAVLSPNWMMFSGPRTARGLALTFDDGPHPVHTPRLLDELARHDIRATFFLVGGCMADHPDLVRRIAAEGHALGHHSWRHLSDGTSPAQLRQEVQQCRDFIRELTGADSNLFRPPRGNLSVAKILNLWRQRQHIVLWNVDPRDYLMQSSAEATAWAGKYQPAAGDVVLLHDDHPFVVGLIPQLAESARALNLTFETIPDWLHSVD